MEHKRNGTDLNAMVLKFDKRRYDGGSEMELIQYIESGQLASSVAMTAPSAPAPVSGASAATATVPAKGGSVSKKPKARSKQVLEVLVLGPMELAVGSVGILTSGLAVVTFAKMNNPEMEAQSKVVLRECVKTLIKGVIDTVFAPIKAIKVAVVGL